MENRKSVAIIGGGSSSLLLAHQLSAYFKVDIYEKGKAIGRKYLVAGKGGFNLAHNFEKEKLRQSFTPTSFLENAIDQFGAEELREWYASIGVNTFVGTSNRIFPEKGISPGDVLRTIKKSLLEKKVSIHTQHEFVGFNKNYIPIIKSINGEKNLEANHYIFCLGGGSWKVTGSNSDWLEKFEEIGVKTAPFESSNCGLNMEWPQSISKNHMGKPLKNVAVSCNHLSVKGEAVLTEYGIEGNAIYPISSVARESLKTDATTQLVIDLKPSLTTQEVFAKIIDSKPSNYGKILKLDAASFALLKAFTSKEEFLDPTSLSEKVKSLTIPVQSLRPLDEAISTVGGIEIGNLNSDYSIKGCPHLFCVGEMVNWDAPTGGFLLQGCFSMANYLSRELIKKG